MHTVRSFTLPDGTVKYRIVYYNHHPRKDNWEILAEVTDVQDALAWVSYLNGGSKPAGPFPPP